MDILAKYILKETGKLSEADILFRNCPQDNEVKHASIILQKIKKEIAKLYEITKNGKSIGFVAVEIYENEYVILAMHSTENCDAFRNIVPSFVEEAKKKGCKCVTFSTVRPGLIIKAQNDGFIISEVVMRKHL